MTTVSLADLRSRLYEAAASQHAGIGDGEAAALICWRDIRPLFPPQAAGPVVDIGCGSGDLVWLLQADGFDALVSAGYRIALAAETGMLRGHIVTQNLTFAARRAAES